MGVLAKINQNIIFACCYRACEMKQFTAASHYKCIDTNTHTHTYIHIYIYTHSCTAISSYSKRKATQNCSPQVEHDVQKHLYIHIYSCELTQVWARSDTHIIFTHASSLCRQLARKHQTSHASVLLNTAHLKTKAKQEV